MSKLDFEPNREVYDKKVNFKKNIETSPGLSEDIVRLISKQKEEPEWMLKKRLEALELFEKTELPKWGPSLDILDFDQIKFYVDPNTKETNSWDEVPDEIKETFERLGIPEAERKGLAGVGAQFDSSMVYHNLEKALKDKGVIFENMDVAVKKYPELVKKYFMKQCIPINDHKFIMLHAAVWSGGTFIYVPENTKVELPLQAYFRMNEIMGGQFEHTLIILEKNAELHYIEGCSSPKYSKQSLHAGCVEIIVNEGAKMRYSSIENWSKNVYNLNTKRAIVHKNAKINWVNGNMGSCKTMLYPCSILIGEGASSDNLGIAFAGKNQDQDTGSKVIHAAKNTSSTIKAKSISNFGGISSYRGLVEVNKNAINTKSSVECDALIIDDKSSSNTYPFMKINNNKINISHEASVGKIGDEQIYYLMSRGLSKEQAIQLIVGGFIEPISKQLPLEYAIELNKLIELEIEGM
ncbi:Fe-S cluster assembly protein SufB [Candidatus Woesearchaeota archaeon]|jgi:Fe-S cluster assembly protein SufB|nr:Fe-S cluster assembly protein SufB [Candidatus Woesearchaeota archaeon]MBT4387088.1 Fe-S cluster assembly protein SufB [Candidatus Woesearchaeota archaeon]MBT4596155.1 Fe-S cluster assembly protein SufB [Candidatus Woesearchaeota archaeon]MBT6505262.1 Fe-S cluster assembly protein SufB [Candidatus Woesearchaeota archaeon]MBT7296690.1 Fe-S cluster assembly protein SufB [Candidatus Woesearchaeota archaeon]